MSELWDEYYRRTNAWREAGDLERLRLVDLYTESNRYRETHPEHQLGLLTQCRNEAQRLNETWWVFFFESWRLSILTDSLHDFARGKPLAMELMVQFNSPVGRTHPLYADVLTSVLYLYLEIDPLGHQDELERGFAYLNEQIPWKPVSEKRFVLNYRQSEYFISKERWSDAYELTQSSLALATETAYDWHVAWSLFLLCRICYTLGIWDEIANHAKFMLDLSAKSNNLKRTLTDAWFWLAVIQQVKGDEKSALNSFHTGMRHLQNLERCNEICADPIATYYEIRGDWRAAAGVRGREIADISSRGRLHGTCLAWIERCRLLKRGGELTSSDLEKAREAISRMRYPDWYLSKLSRIETQ